MNRINLFPIKIILKNCKEKKIKIAVHTRSYDDATY